jgi:hypothetical protein
MSKQNENRDILGLLNYVMLLHSQIQYKLTNNTSMNEIMEKRMESVWDHLSQEDKTFVQKHEMLLPTKEHCSTARFIEQVHKTFPQKKKEKNINTFKNVI